MTKYIRGWRQFKAIYYFLECFFKRNIPCAKRELEIIMGYAKPYEIRFAPTFWGSCRELGMIEEDIEELKSKYDPTSLLKEKGE
jgi:hypothetical protein